MRLEKRDRSSAFSHVVGWTEAMKIGYKINDPYYSRSLNVSEVILKISTI